MIYSVVLVSSIQQSDIYIYRVAKNRTQVKQLTIHTHIYVWNPMDGSPPGSSVHGILQARILEWIAQPSSRGSSQPRNSTCVSCTTGRFFTAKPPGKLFQIIFQYKLLQDIAPCYTLGPCLDFFYHYNITHSCSGKTIDLKSILSLTSFVY